MDKDIHAKRQHHHFDIDMRSASEGDKTCKFVCTFSQQDNNEDFEGRTSSTRKLIILIIFYSLAMAVEIIGGIKSNSLAILTDAAHMFTDVAGFAISLFAVWASGWKATSKQSFGFYRIEVLAALLSVQLIWFISGILTYKSVDRIIHDREKINGKVMFLVAAFGSLINFTMVTWLGHNHLLHDCGTKDHPHSQHDDKGGILKDSLNLVSDSHSETKNLNINLRGAYLHVVTDLIQSIGVMISGAIIWAKPNWVVLDLICTSAFSLLVLISTLSLLENVLGIQMERVPREIDIVDLENGLKSLKDVSEVHDLHVWSITVGKNAMSCHVLTEHGVDSKNIIHAVRQFCNKSHGIYHVTVQVEQK